MVIFGGSRVVSHRGGEKERRRRCDAVSSFDRHHGFRYHGGDNGRPGSDGERPDRQHWNQFRSAQRADVIVTDGVIIFDRIGWRVRRIGNGNDGERRRRQQQRRLQRIVVGYFSSAVAAIGRDSQHLDAGSDLNGCGRKPLVEHNLPAAGSDLGWRLGQSDGNGRRLAQRMLSWRRDTAGLVFCAGTRRLAASITDKRVTTERAKSTSSSKFSCGQFARGSRATVRP